MGTHSTIQKESGLLPLYLEYSYHLSGLFTLNFVCARTKLSLCLSPYTLFFRCCCYSNKEYLRHLLVYIFLAVPGGLWDLSFSDQESSPCPLLWKLQVLTTGLPGKSQQLTFEMHKCISHCVLGYQEVSGNFLVVQWLPLHVFTPMGLGLIPDWGTKIPQATWHS